MARYYISDEQGLFTADIETAGAVLTEGFDDDRAMSVVSSALLLALASLAEGGDWPTLALEHLRDFMLAMHQRVREVRLM